MLGVDKRESHGWIQEPLGLAGGGKIHQRAEYIGINGKETKIRADALAEQHNKCFEKAKMKEK